MRLHVGLMAALVLIAPFVLAGCTEAPAADDATDDVDTTMEANNTTLGPKVFSGSGTITAGGPVFSTGSPGTPFQVADGATLIFAEIRWDDPVNDIDLALASPSAGTTGGVQNYDHVASGGAPGSPNSPHSLTLTGEDVESGDWLMSAFPNGATANVAYSVVATVFYGETAVPDGYTGFDG